MNRKEQLVEDFGIHALLNHGFVCDFRAFGGGKRYEKVRGRKGRGKKRRGDRNGENESLVMYLLMLFSSVQSQVTSEILKRFLCHLFPKTMKLR